MKILFVRHSEPDYSQLDLAGETYAGFGRDLAPLTEKGRSLATEIASNPIFTQAEVVLTSSVTRALETAFYIACEQKKPLLVEPFFHEWRPDMTGQNSQAADALYSHRLFLENKGALADNSPVRYETATEVKDRFLQALEKYRCYEKVVIVTHGMVIKQFIQLEEIAYCQVIEVEL